MNLLLQPFTVILPSKKHLIGLLPPLTGLIMFVSIKLLGSKTANAK
jgi:hypothetical protein